MCACPPLGSRDESLLGAIGEEVLETRFHIFIAQYENRSASSLKEFSSPVAVLFPSQFSSDVGVDKIHDAGEVCRTSDTQEKGTMIGQVCVAIQRKFIPLLGLRDDSQNEAGASRGRAHEVAALYGANGDFRDGDGVPCRVFPEFGVFRDESKGAGHRLSPVWGTGVDIEQNVELFPKPRRDCRGLNRVRPIQQRDSL